MNVNLFADLPLCPPLLKALAEEGYSAPTPIQAQAIPFVIEGKDVLATAQTGTGKTAAFSLPILNRLAAAPRERRAIRCLALSPTRELALQIEDSMRRYGRHLPLKTAVVVGGVGFEPQIRAVRNRPDILVATPGRLIDLLNRKVLSLGDVETFVLDEADRMLDMGFIRDVRRIVSELPAERQTLFFSATMPKEVLSLASSILKDPVQVEVTPPASVSTSIEQKVLFVEQANKNLLLQEVLKDAAIRRVLVFTRTKHRANRLARQLSGNGISSDAIHSNKSQNARQRALSDFDRGRIRVLIATDIVARGIDVEGISHVINFELPNDPESYVHRIGRTARAGASGIALSFCAHDEVAALAGIEKLTKKSLLAEDQHSFHSPAIAALRAKKAQPQGQSPGNGRRHDGRGGNRWRGRPRHNNSAGGRQGAGSTLS